MYVDKECVDKVCVDKECVNKECVDKECVDKECVDKECVDKECVDKVCVDKECVDKECVDKECVDKVCVDKECVDKECVDKECVDKECVDKECVEVEEEAEEEEEAAAEHGSTESKTRTPHKVVGNNSSFLKKKWVVLSIAIFDYGRVYWCIMQITQPFSTNHIIHSRYFVDAVLSILELYISVGVPNNQHRPHTRDVWNTPSNFEVFLLGLLHASPWKIYLPSHSAG